MRAALLALLFAAVPVRAAFEEAPESARAAAMGNAFTAVADDAVCAYSNPAALGPIRRLGVGLDYLRQFDIPAGKTDQDRFGAISAIPVQQELIRGTFGIDYAYNRLKGRTTERSAMLSYGTRSLVEKEGWMFDLGGSLKILSRSNDAGGGAAKPAVDLGALWRIAERYAVGVSILNANRPRFDEPDGFVDRAPAAFKVGVSEAVRGFTLALDLTKREPSGRHPGSGNLASGLERWWATPRHGSFAGRMGLSLSDRSKMFSWGLGWRILGGQVDYAMTVPMQGSTVMGHAVSMLFRFGVSNPEQEYERVLAEEVGYRRDLTQALESAETKQWRLAEELGRLREEIDLLRGQLLDKTASESQARQRIKDLEERRRAAEQKFDSMQKEQKRLAERSQQAMFDDDWNAYLKLKLSGAPDAVLLDQVKRILRQYKDKGVDLSSANQELLRLLRAK